MKITQTPPTGALLPSRRTFIRVSASVGAASIIVGSTSACGGSSSGGGNTAFAWQCGWYPGAEYMGEITALKKGYYEEVGLDVTLEPGGPNAVIDALVSEGQRNAAASATDKVASAFLNGLDNLRIVGAGYQVTASCVVSLADNPIAQPEDLIGAKFGVSQADLPVYEAFFKKVGLDVDQVEYVPSANDPAMLIAGDVDCISSTLPNYPVTLREKGYDVVTLALGDFGYERWSGVQFVRQEDLDDDDKRATLEDFLRATIRGYQTAREDPAAAAQLIVDEYAEQYGYTIEQTTASAEEWAKLLITPDTEAGGLLRMSAEGIQRQGEFLEGVGLGLDTNTVFVPEILDEIYGDSNSL